MRSGLQAQDIVKKFKGKLAVNGVSFSIAEGECLGLVGESGCGKSTLAGIITGMLTLSNGKVLLGESEIVSKNNIDRRLISESMQMVFQNPATSFDIRKTILYSVTEPLYYEKQLSAADKRSLAAKALEQVGLNRGYLCKYAWELSGGECQRAALARAIIKVPKLLICDEATSALDVSVQAQIVQLISELRSEMGMSILFISHDISLVCGLCDSIAVMNGGKLVEYASADEILRNPQQDYTRLLLKMSGYSSKTAATASSKINPCHRETLI